MKADANLSKAVLKNRTPRGKQVLPVKARVTIRLPRDVQEAFRATGKGWQTRLGFALQDWLKTHKANDLIKMGE